MWRARAWPISEAARHAPCTARWRAVSGTVGHTFTHFHLEMAVVKGRTNGVEVVDGVWVRPADFGNHALPTLMKKIARHAQSKSALAHADAPRLRAAVAVSG
ncbi:MAG: NUDIX domain-containing protein [Proteobacteria bacterium]|nr:NUDIX domain-containing protein [Pseudomonadota bacterium]